MSTAFLITELVFFIYGSFLRITSTYLPLNNFLDNFQYN